LKCPICPGLLYVNLQMTLAQKSNGYFTIKEAKEYMWKIPKKLRSGVLKEMETMRLIKIDNENGTIKVINCDYSADDFEDINILTRRARRVEKILETKKAGGFFDF